MGSWIESVCVQAAAKLGYRLEKRYKPKLRSPIPPGARLYVGCGDQQLDGFLGCDLRPLPHVQLACRAWEVSQFCRDLDEIYSRHMLEHLTLREAQLTLQDWYAALSPSGVLRIEVPNIDFAMNQWQRAEWTDDALRDKFSDARWGFAGFFGWQRECDPEQADYNQSYWDVHKSGYTQASLRHFLLRAGFQQIDIHCEGFTAAQNRRRKLAPHLSANCHLVATAQKFALQVQRVA